ncbi:MAG: type II/IV secretion system protein [Verrucomicrobiaceae bacterium]|nr:type II/IV secretion system protein [Verrucomicrobiaceae bacterium]
MILLQQAALKAGMADQEAFTVAKQQALTGGQSFVQELINTAKLDERKFLHQLAGDMKWPWLEAVQPDPTASAELKGLIPARFAVKHQILPVKFESREPQAEGAVPNGAHPARTILIACHDPFDLVARQAVARRVTMPVRWCLSPQTEIVAGLQALYGVGADTFEDLIKSREGTTTENADEANEIDVESPDASVVKFVNQIIREGLAQRATDIHVEPLPDSLRIRYRIDGILHEVSVPENIKQLQSSVIARIKIMSKLDVAERRLPQDGRINLKTEGQFIDVRVACIPSVEGESLSLRLLGQERFTIGKLGMSEDYRAKIDVLLKKPNGIVLVTGPTGSGKSTTLYSFLSELNKIERRIVTIEDPVENKLAGIVQIAVKPEIGLTFAAGLRSILRGDPNVVMVGEMRDLETAEIAVRASLTGHLVFSTLHTNDSIGGITRLVEMGIEPFLVGSSVRALIAQRLVRALCDGCKRIANYEPDTLRPMGLVVSEKDRLYSAAPGGCKSCNGSGYRGRIAIFEIALMTPAMQHLVNKRASEAEMFNQARTEGFVTMREYGWRKVKEGVTSVEEVLRVTSEDAS